ncbi:hypothetical protein F5Y15DRAFT_425046 [Xylariaceae sp. FL0016]|nr:hypothetical protein F5Y15DRAFT_425046 [Xylariaceae sp. FL0016]
MVPSPFGHVTTPKLACGLCGLDRPRDGDKEHHWTHYIRAVYYTGSDSDVPCLSGVGFHHDANSAYLLPPEYHQRYNDDGLDSQSLIAIRGLSPPGPDVPVSEKAAYSWGFVFHESCWKLLEQAMGHTYGGLFLGTSPDRERGGSFVLLGENSHLVIPSTSADPLRVPELDALLARCHIKDAKQTEIQTLQYLSLSHSSREKDPFFVLPLELRDLLFTYLGVPDVLSLRLASREIASTPLSQYFFQSQFYTGRDLEAFFDGFLLKGADRLSLDWKTMYREMRMRLINNMTCLGERNRLRIWNQTIRPIRHAIEQVSQSSELRGGPDWEWNLENGGEADWKFVKSSRNVGPEQYGEIRRETFRAEAHLPATKVQDVFVSFVEFFGHTYVTGLRFTFEAHPDVEIGYINRVSEAALHINGDLQGFHAVVGEGGLRGLAPYMHTMSEYLQWVGDVADLPYIAIRSSGKPVRKVRAALDASLRHGLSKSLFR